MSTLLFQHTAEAIEVARGVDDSFTSWDVDKEAIERGWTGVGILPVSIHRDSEPLELANWDAIGIAIDAISDEVDGDQWDYLLFTHWAVGWVKLGIYNSGNRAVFDRVNEITAELVEYPVVDEDLYHVYEWKNNHPVGDENCYSEFDCNCGRTRI